MSKMRIIPMDSFPPNVNPYLEDAYNMGVSIGKNIEIMYPCHESERCKFFYIVNRETGERLKILVDKEMRDERSNVLNDLNDIFLEDNRL